MSIYYLHQRPMNVAMAEHSLIKAGGILDELKNTPYSQLLKINLMDDDGLELEPYEVLVQIAIGFAQLAEAMDSYQRAHNMSDVG